MSVSSLGAVAPVLSPASWGGRLLKSFSQKKMVVSNESLSSGEDSTFEVHLVDEEPIRVNLNRLRENVKYNEILIQVTFNLYFTCSS